MLPFSNLLVGQRINTADPGDVVFESTPNGAGDEQQIQYWTCPPGVYEVALEGIGPGGNGHYRNANGVTIIGGSGNGGDNRWVNNIPVEPGRQYFILTRQSTALGVGGGYIGFGYVTPDNTVVTLLQIGGGRGSQFADKVGSTPLGPHPLFPYLTVGGGDGGAGSLGINASYAGGGGGAGGYSGNGGSGTGSSNSIPGGGQGGAGSGGPGSSSAGNNASGGGGVALYGEGPSGVGSTSTPGKGGSGGGDGDVGVSGSNSIAATGRYGGGGRGYYSTGVLWGLGQKGGFRILWGRGPNNGGRAFPATRVDTKEGHAGNSDVTYSTTSDQGVVTQYGNLPAMYDGAISPSQSVQYGIKVTMPSPRYVRLVNVAAFFNGTLPMRYKIAGGSIVTSSYNFTSNQIGAPVLINAVIEWFEFGYDRTGLQIQECAPVYTPQ